jgi:hypothetical protein
MIRRTLCGRSGSWLESWSESELLSSVICSQDWSLPYGVARSWTNSWRKSLSWIRGRFDSRSWRHQI